MENETERRDVIGVTSGRLRMLRDWFDACFPMSKFWNEQVAQYYAPKNLNFWYFFGSIALRFEPQCFGFHWDATGQSVLDGDWPAHCGIVLSVLHAVLDLYPVAFATIFCNCLQRNHGYHQSPG